MAVATFHFAVLTHNRSRSLIALLESIRDLHRPAGARFDVTVFDNASDDEHVRRVTASGLIDGLGASYVYSRENVFMSAKWHLETAILERWSGERDVYLIHVDDDVQFRRPWLVNAWSALRRERYDACGSVEMWAGRLVFSGQTTLHVTTEHVDGRPVKTWEWQWQSAPEDARSSPVEFAGHRALMVRMEAAALVRHDPGLLIGGEDVDYSLALRQAGYAIGIAHDARIEHRALGEVDAPGFRTYDKVLESWRRFYGKWGFVRRNANNEAGVSVEEWLRLVSRA
jgi:GT2 family glycosyltransferase